MNNYYIWVEINANKKRLTDRERFTRVLDNCARSEINSIILAIKSLTGFGIYKSKIVPHYSLVDGDFDSATDYLQMCIDEGHKRGLKVLAAVDIFAEGKVGKKNMLSPGHKHPEWQTHIYGLDSSGKANIKPVGDAADIKPVNSVDDFNDIFVNPVREDVQEYELGIIKEIIENYEIDGIVLDRVRFIGLGADFSDYTRERFENYIGAGVENWPGDIYKLKLNEGKVEVEEYGLLFGKWLAFRAGIIKEFILKAKELIKGADRKVEFLDYTGSWYPIYYQLGANWASEKYIPEEYPWVEPEYSKTGYAEYVDKLLSGFYYPEVTVEEAAQNNRPEYWYSVEGSGIITSKVVGSAAPVIGSLFVLQYQGNPEKFKKAVEMCFKKSSGCMIFDLCYIDDYNWWDSCKIE